MLVDNLVTNSLYTNVIPRGMSEDLCFGRMIQLAILKCTSRKYAVNETRINSSIGDIEW